MKNGIFGGKDLWSLIIFI